MIHDISPGQGNFSAYPNLSTTQIRKKLPIIYKLITRFGKDADVEFQFHARRNSEN